MNRPQALIFQRSYAMVPHRVPRFLLYIARNKFTPGTVSAYMPAVLPCCGAVCAFVCVPGAVRGSIRTMVWYDVLVCCVFDAFPVVWCVSRRRSVWFTFLYGAFMLYLFPVVFQAARSLFRGLRSCSRRSCSFMVVTVPGGVLSFRRVLLRSGLLSYYHTTTLYRRIGSLFVQIPMFSRRS